MGQPAPKHKQQRGISSIERLTLGAEKDQFLESFALLITSGMGVLVALEALLADARSSTMKRVIEQMRLDVDAGQSLSTAFEASGILSSDVISLVRIGEEAGRLPENLKVIAIQQQKERQFQSKLVSAMIYPVLVFSVTILVGLVIAWFVLPRLSLVFGQLNIELPFITKLMIGFGQFLGQYGFVAVPATAVALILGMYLIFFATQTKIIGERLILAIPGLRKIIIEVELARFGYIMGTLLHAGLPVVETLQSIANSTPTASYRKLYQHLKSSIEEGNSFRKSLDSYPGTRQLIPIPIQQLISASEMSGSLSESFLKISSVYEEKTDVTTKNLVVIIEPILLVVVWLGVVLVAVAVIMPIYKLVGDFNTGTSTTPTPPVDNSAPAALAPGETDGYAITGPADSQPVEPVVLGAHDQIDPLLVDAGQLLPTATVIESAEFSTLNVRSEPSTTASVIKQLHTGETYPVIETNSTWTKIQLTQGGTGWVASQYITLLQP
ncbi:MAG: type II secretion system F family protein [Patescibacteria group bacterium]